MRIQCLQLALGLGLWLPVLAHAAFSALLWDNDLFSPRNTDAYYTNGFLYHHVSDPVSADEGRGWTSCPGLSWLAEAAEPLLIKTDEQSQFRHSWGLGQIIQTPSDLTLNPPDPDDQPYAGLLYGSCGAHAQAEDRAESLGLMLGVVGPLSLAEKTQDIAHRVTGSEYPQGWDYQLVNEPVLNLVYDRQRVMTSFSLNGHSITLFENFGLAFGNLMISGTVGANALYARNPRAAFSLRPNFLGRYPWLSQSQPLGFYALGSVQGMAVGRNLFLDGNTFKDGPSVDKEYVVGSGQLVMGYGFSCLALQLGLSFSTRTFKSQIESWPRYGTLAVIWGCSP
ncbi:MAG: lipid A deacylase LpxR family protein [Moraxellaceae bacterium]